MTMKQCNAKAVHGGEDKFPDIIFFCTRGHGHKGKHNSLMVHYGKKSTHTFKWKWKKEPCYLMTFTSFWL